MQNYTKAFHDLFHGLDRAYGIYDLTDSRNKRRESGNKKVGKAKTVKDTVTKELWESHLLGDSGIGIIPILDDSTCFFGAIDIDVYSNLDLKLIFDLIVSNDLPLVPCRTKSGGLHLYCFVSSPVPASLMREKLEDFSAFLGFGGSEIFPKQDEILSDRGDIGQWINMPYFGLDESRAAYNPSNGEFFSAKRFIKFAYALRLTSKEFKAFKVKIAGDISDGPPCLQYLITRGFEEGVRNDGLFNVGVYLKKAFPDSWKDYLDTYNTKYFSPPLASSEVQNLIKSLNKKDGYNFTCSKNPLKNHCNIVECRTRKFGVSTINGAIKLTNLTKFDSCPPIWFVDVEGGGRLELQTEDLHSQQRFQRKCMESLNMMPPLMKLELWRGEVQRLMDEVNIVEAPEDASSKGLLFDYLERFCTSRAQARNKDELLLGKPWTDEGTHHFRMIDFLQYLERHRFNDFKVHRISAMLKDSLCAEQTVFKIKGKTVRLWKIAEFDKQDSDFDVPDYVEEVF